MQYSKTTNGFYPDKTNNPNLPSDVVTIEADYHQELLIGLEDGTKKIGCESNGYPILIDKYSKKELKDKEKEMEKIKIEGERNEKIQQLLDDSIKILILDHPSLKANKNTLKKLGFFNKE